MMRGGVRNIGGEGDVGGRYMGGGGDVDKRYVGGAGKWKMYRWAGQEKHTTGINVAGNTNTTNSNDSPHTVKYRSVNRD